MKTSRGKRLKASAAFYGISIMVASANYAASPLSRRQRSGSTIRAYSLKFLTLAGLHGFKSEKIDFWFLDSSIADWTQTTHAFCRNFACMNTAFEISVKSAVISGRKIPATTKSLKLDCPFCWSRFKILRLFLCFSSKPCLASSYAPRSPSNKDL